VLDFARVQYFDGEERHEPDERSDRKDPHRVQVAPASIADVAPEGGRRRVGIVTVEPDADVEEVELFAPEHAGECLALDELLVGAGPGRVDRGVEFVGFGPALAHDLFDIPQRMFDRACESHVPRRRSPPWNRSPVVEARFRAGARRVHRRLLAVHDQTVEGVFGVRTD